MVGYIQRSLFRNTALRVALRMNGKYSPRTDLFRAPLFINPIVHGSHDVELLAGQLDAGHELPFALYQSVVNG
jgi:hypothetical protein